MRIFILAFVAFLTTASAVAEEIGIMVTVQVLDTEGLPIPTAVVRHPSEQDRHRVNYENGKWEASVLYLPNGDELVFLKGMELEFEISAPGYENASIVYTVRKRKNLAQVFLKKMEIDLNEDEDLEDPVIQFGRDKPID